MNEPIVFAAGTAFLLWVSWPSLRRPMSHGFYRFIAWECMLGLVLVNMPMWQVDPYGLHQLASWALQLISLAVVIAGTYYLLSFGRPSPERGGEELFGFERTSSLVTHGIFRYIRHPMYAALLYLAVAAYLKDVTWPSTLLVVGVTVSLYLTAVREEAECVAYFGQAYADYMKTNRRFVPFVF